MIYIATGGGTNSHRNDSATSSGTNSQKTDIATAGVILTNIQLAISHAAKITLTEWFILYV